jgi:hypothetical protein
MAQVKQRWTPEQIERGLREVAQANGNTRTAAEALAQDGPPIPRSTLRNWLRQHPELYRQLVAQESPDAPRTRRPVTALPPDAGQANGNRVGVLDNARELIADRLEGLDAERESLGQRLTELTGGKAE